MVSMIITAPANSYPEQKIANLDPTDLRCTILSYAASYWASLYPYWAMLYPNWAMLHPTELRCTLLSYSAF
jgi:hypothetical protein